MKKTFLLAILCILFSILIISCNNEIDPLNVNQIKSYILEKSFTNSCKYNDDNQTYTFKEDGTFIHASINKKTSEKKSYKGSYEIKSSKYKDTGMPFVYLKLSYSDNSWTNVSEYFVFHHNSLTEPVYHGETSAALNIKAEEDAFSLNIPNYLVKGALDCEIAYVSARVSFSEESFQRSNSQAVVADMAKAVVDSSRKNTFRIPVDTTKQSMDNSNLENTNNQIERTEIQNKLSFQYEPGNYITNGSKDHYVYFYSAPDESTKRKAHFDSQETIYIQKIKNSFGFVEYTNTMGQKSIGWLNMNDLIVKP